jgi:Mg-chelatase subunit ChlI
MPIDDETRRELEAIRAEMRDELRAATSSRERDHVRGETRVDLEDVLRSEGYRLSRRELDELMSARDDARLEAKLDAMLEERARVAAEDEEEEDGDGDDDDAKKKKPPTKKTTAKTTAGAKSDDDEEEEWK